MPTEPIVVPRIPWLTEPPEPAIGSPNPYAATEALTDSTLPFLMDVHDWARLPERFQRQIEREYVVLMPRLQPTPS